MAGDGLLSGLLHQSGLKTYLDDPQYTEIAVNRPFEIWTENSQGWQKHDAPALTRGLSESIANSFAIFNGTEVNFKQPICSGIMPEGQRGQVVIPSACERDTVAITIRRASDTRFKLSDYIDSGRLSRWVDVSSFKTANTVLSDSYRQAAEERQAKIDQYNQDLAIPSDVQLQLFELEMLYAKAIRDIERFIHLAVEYKQNIVLVGATGSGKTTFTKAVCDIVPLDTRIITIEDTAELSLPYHANRVHLFYKDVTPKELLRSCMRMKPDRIFLTELRGDEAWDYLNALNTGHAGSITTVHANDCNAAYYRVGSLIKQSDVGVTMPFEQIMTDVFTTLDVVMFLDHTYVTEISYDPVRKYRLLKGKAV